MHEVQSMYYIILFFLGRGRGRGLVRQRDRPFRFTCTLLYKKNHIDKKITLQSSDYSLYRYSP